MLHGGNHTCGNHPFTYSASHKDKAVRTKNLKFGLITLKDRFPPVLCPLLMFLGPSKSLLIVEGPPEGRLGSWIVAQQGMGDKVTRGN